MRKFLFSFIAAYLLAFALPCPAQVANVAAAQAPLATPSLTLTLADAPQPVASANVQRVGNPGFRTFYYWIVTNTLIGGSTPAGPFILDQVPDALGTNSVSVSWTKVANATSYDVLRTSSATPPAGACNCAVASGVTGTSATDASESLSAYTVAPIDANQHAITLTNKSTGPGASAVDIPVTKAISVSGGTASVTSLTNTGTTTLGSNGQTTVDASGSLKAPKINGTVNADTLPGADICAGISSAAAFSRVVIPPGTYTCTNKITLDYGVTIESAEGYEQTKINMNQTGVGLEAPGFNTIRGITFSFAESITDGLKIRGSENKVVDCNLIGGGALSKLVHITAFNETILSGKITLDTIHSHSYKGSFIYSDHVVSTTMKDINISTTIGPSRGLVMDTGMQGSNISMFQSVGATEGGMLVTNSTPGEGVYNSPPYWLFADQVIMDCDPTLCTTPGKNAIEFDSSLGSQFLGFKFNNSWAAGYPGNGIKISGGTGILWDTGQIRANGLNGVLIDNANVSHVTVSNSIITANNYTDTADTHGIFVNQNVLGVNISNNTIENALDGNGHQRFGIRFSSFLCDKAAIIGNKCDLNVDGCYQFWATGTKNICGNSVSTGATADNFVSSDTRFRGYLYDSPGVYAGMFSATSGGYHIYNGVTDNVVLPSTLTGYTGSDGTKVVLATTTSSGHVSCWTATGRAGYCSTAVDADGKCTCN